MVWLGKNDGRGAGCDCGDLGREDLVEVSQMNFKIGLKLCLKPPISFNY